MRTNLILIAVLFMSCLLASCDKMPKNGDLDGMWQLMTIEKVGESPRSVKAEKRYYSFQLDLTQFSQADSVQSYYAYFRHKGDSLFIYKICHPSTNESAADNNVPFTENDLVRIEPWGIYTLNPHFKVGKLDSDDMILQSDEARLTFRKF